MYKTIEITKQNQVTKITLNRPEIHNAINDELINDLYDAFEKLNDDDKTRVIILTGNGSSFCAGADLNWMKSVVNYSYKQNYNDALKLAKLMFLIFKHSKPVIARVNGSAVGGGVGLMSVCDILVASDKAKFGLSEVRLGLVPSVISPFVISRIGEAKAREIFITGERITAKEALEIKLLNYIAPLDKLDDIINDKVKMILNNGPNAVKAAKELIVKVTHMSVEEFQHYTAELIADLRLSEEGQEGMNAFLEKREPKWVKE